MHQLTYTVRRDGRIAVAVTWDDNYTIDGHVYRCGWRYASALLQRVWDEWADRPYVVRVRAEPRNPLPYPHTRKDMAA